MKKNLVFLTIIVLVLSCVPVLANAASYVGITTGSDVWIRTSPGTNGDKIKMVSLGVTYKMSDNTIYPDESTNPSNLCSNGWYKVTYAEGKEGYICSNFLSVNQVVEKDPEPIPEPSTDCESYMKSHNIPSDYWKSLCALKTKHPTWEFQGISQDANGDVVDFNLSVAAESGCGSNTIVSTAKAEYINTGCSSKTDSGYTHASEAAVRYYMNPLNFLDEVNIFMFESEDLNTSISQDTYKSVTDKMFGNSFLVQQIPELTSYIKKASEDTLISQTAIASRIKQELGSAKLSSSATYAGQLYSVVSGNYTTRFPTKLSSDGHSLDHYYNFYNIAAYDGSDVTHKALNYAYNHGWGGTKNQSDDRQKAVTGGADWIKEKYIAAGQNTIYFHKFNIFPTSTTSRYTHQYMTNIQAPVSEAKILYNAYKDAGMLESAFKFIIPVFSNIDYVSTDGGSSESSKPAVSTAVTSSGYSYSSGYISKFELGKDVNDIKSNLESQGLIVSITDANGNPVSGAIATGYRITVTGSTTETLIAVVYGDVSGDGQINALDLLKVQKSILGTGELNGSYKSAADVSKDGTVNALDLLKVQKHILGSASIEQ